MSEGTENSESVLIWPIQPRGTFQPPLTAAPSWVTGIRAVTVVP